MSTVRENAKILLTVIPLNCPNSNTKSAFLDSISLFNSYRKNFSLSQKSMTNFEIAAIPMTLQSEIRAL